MSDTLPHELKIAREASIGLGGSALGSVLRYTFNVLVARFLGMHFLGLYSLGNVAVNVAAVFGRLGLDMGLLRFLARFKALKQESLINATIKRAVIIGAISGLLISIALIMGTDALRGRIFQHSPPEAGVLFKWYFATIPLLILTQVLAGASQGLKVLKHRVLVLNIIPATVLCFGFLGMFFWASPLESLVVPYLASQIVAFGAAVWFIRQLMPREDHRAAQPPPGLVKFSLPLMFASLIGILIHWSDILMLGILTDTGTVGLYQPAARTAGLIVVFTTSLSGIWAPIVSGLDSQNEHHRIAVLLRLITRWSIAIAWPSFLFLMLYGSKVMLLFGAEFLAVVPALQVLALGQLVTIFALGSANVLIMTGHPKIAMINNTLTLTINVVANLVLIPRMGVMGAALGSLIALSVLAVARLVEVLVIHRLHPFAVHQLKPLVAGLGALVIGMALNRVIYNWHTILVLLVAVLVFTGVYFSLLYALRLEPEDREVLRAFRRKFKRWRS